MKTTRRELTAEENARVDAAMESLRNEITKPVIPPAPDGNAHWPSQPTHTIADMNGPARLPKKKVPPVHTLGELQEIAAKHKEMADAQAEADRVAEEAKAAAEAEGEEEADEVEDKVN